MELTLKREERAVFALREIFESYGYLPYKMSRFEEYELYVRNKDFLISDRVITFSDRSGRLLALKPDVTLSIIKNVQDEPGKVLKVFYNENVYRPSDSDQGFKEILQSGLECVGDLSEFDIREVVLLAMRSLAALEHAYLLDISHIGLISSVMERVGLCGAQKRRAMEYLRTKNSHEMQQLCQNLSQKDAALLTAFTQVYGIPEKVFETIIPLLETKEEYDFICELRGICDMLSMMGFSEHIRVDFSVGSDMKYYSGVVFKGYLEGLPFGILSGGAYDKLLKKMGKGSRAIGFAIYLDLLKRYEEISERTAVDTLLLYDDSANPEMLMLTCEALRKQGSVLAAKELPSTCVWNRLVKYKDGETVRIETDG